ncbi:hypothetical protein EJ110_NYTH15586 [Nymphaea thermarum]|nr:hypothetical protein EJ110_NYTH15586 [Nymphaea thermarum]
MAAQAIVLTLLEKVLGLAQQEISKDVTVKAELAKLERFNVLAYDAEDVIDIYKVKCNAFVEVGSQMNKSFNMLRKEVSLWPHSKGRGIFIRWGCEPVGIENPQTNCFITEPDVIGREGDEKLVVAWLMEDLNERKENASVIAIVGMGCLGKTTITKKLYNSSEVRGYFNKRMWVCVSEKPNLLNLSKKIMEEICVNESGANEFTNGNAVHSKIRSKVLITTRNNVAKGMNAYTLHEMKCVSIEQSWCLFQSKLHCLPRFGGNRVKGMRLLGAVTVFRTTAKACKASHNGASEVKIIDDGVNCSAPNNEVQFHKPEELRLFGLTSLEKLSCTDSRTGTMPSLKRLQISRCGHLKTIPLFTTLVELEIDSVGRWEGWIGDKERGKAGATTCEEDAHPVLSKSEESTRLSGVRKAILVFSEQSRGMALSRTREGRRNGGHIAITRNNGNQTLPKLENFAKLSDAGRTKTRRYREPERMVDRAKK